MKITLTVIFLFFLTSCSFPLLNQNTYNLSYKEYKDNLPTTITKKFKLDGKISLFVNNKGQTGKILWLHQGNKDSIDILNPFNTKIAGIKLYELEKKVILKFSNKNDQNSEEIISKIFGSEENIFLLKEFIINPPKQLATIDNISIKYNNWSIFYKGNKTLRGRLIPNTIEFKKNNISLKVFITDWVI